MNIICGTRSEFKQYLSITETLESMGHSVRFFPTESYREVCSYPEKKIDKLGFHQGRNRYRREWIARLCKTIEELHSDVILFLDSPKNILRPEDMDKIKRVFAHPRKIVCWFVDTVIDSEGEASFFPYYDRIYVFEKRDIPFLKEHHHITAEYCPVGYNAAYARAMRKQDKDVDIAFMGAAFRNRLRILEEVAAHAARNRWSMEICGPFYEEKYFWKEHLFQKKYPYIMKYLKTNGVILPEKAAELYARSKICLNIHHPEHKGVNPRTFEIMVTGSFQLIDEREDYAGLVPEQDMAVFRSTGELIEKISYYLAHEDERERIAAHGHAAVLGRYSMEASLNRILNDCRE